MATLLACCIEAVQADLAGGGFAAELVVVDNGSTAAERALLKELPVRTIAGAGNRGYAAALNSGIANTSADVVFLMNPDVLLLPGCTAALVGALRNGAAAAGPRLYWDRGRQILLPPTEERTRRAELAGLLAGRGDRAASWARRRWRRHARRHWLARAPLASTSLSGALLAVRREALERVGPFDERFRLYFEENDWLARLARRGLAAVHVPGAEAVHLYNQSAAHEPAAAQWFAESRARFAKRHYGAWFARLMAVAGPSAAPRLTPPPLLAEERPRVALPDAASATRPLWVEISPLARGFPAGAARIEDRETEAWELPEEVWSHMTPGRYFLNVCSAAGEELFRASVERPSEPAAAA